MAELCETVAVSAGDVAGLTEFAVREQIDLVFIGPEQPLAAGLVDACLERGLRVFGPSQRAAQLETSKAFAKTLMREAGVPTAAFEVFDDVDEALRAVHRLGAPLVVKADGLAAGKGVVVANTLEEAEQAVRRLMVDRQFGGAGTRVVLEQRLRGTEVSQMFFVDGETLAAMPPARDHKRLGDGDTGPNTGGMGAFAPVTAFAERGLLEEVEQRIVRPTLAALRRRGIEYRGVLYVGLMITEDGPYVIEFNARFGDPETQAVLPLLASDLLEVAWAVADGRLAEIDVRWNDAAAACVVLAAPGYPEAPETGAPIRMDGEPVSISANRIHLTGGAASEGIGTAACLFHAGTAMQNGQLVTAGGRVLAAVGVGPDLDEALRVAYKLADAVHFEGKQIRRDIGRQRGL
jgi:phosphoribosylamine--glycine ligase